MDKNVATLWDSGLKSSGLWFHVLSVVSLFQTPWGPLTDGPFLLMSHTVSRTALSIAFLWPRMSWQPRSILLTNRTWRSHLTIAGSAPGRNPEAATSLQKVVINPNDCTLLPRGYLGHLAVQRLQHPHLIYLPMDLVVLQTQTSLCLLQKECVFIY